MSKKLLTTITCLLLLSGGLAAQGFHYGLKTDLNFSKVSGNGLKKGFNPGFDAGVFAEYDFSAKWGVQPELLYNLLNGKRDDDFMTYYVNSGNSGANTPVRLSYLSLPVLLRYNINDVLTVNAGPQYSLLLFADEDLVRNNKAAFKKSDIGVAVGLTVNVAQMRFYGRYVLGLSDVNDIDERYQWNTQQIQIGLGVTFR